MQQESVPANLFSTYQSLVHSQTLPAMSTSPKSLAGNLPTGVVAP
jgi:hypothetical protein